MVRAGDNPALYAPPNGRPFTFLYFRPAEMTARMPRAHSPNMRPRDAATLIIYDECNATGGVVRVLMGRRDTRHKFMPDKLVFPGGRVEPQDYRTVADVRLDAVMVAKLLRHTGGIPHPRRAYALVRGALRETREETGLLAVGQGALRGHGVEGSGLTFVARAITPPRRPRRFDTRFFALSARYAAGEASTPDGEFSSVHWLTLHEARAAGLPAITHAVLDDFDARLRAGRLADASVPVPFYFMRGACYHRHML